MRCSACRPKRGPKPWEAWNVADRPLLLQLMQQVHSNLDALMPGTADRSGVGAKQAAKATPRRARLPSQAA